MFNLFDQAQSANTSGYHYSLQGWIILIVGGRGWAEICREGFGGEGGGGGVSILEWEGLWE